jgi:hypothetical protein
MPREHEPRQAGNQAGRETYVNGNSNANSIPEYKGVAQLGDAHSLHSWRARARRRASRQQAVARVYKLGVRATFELVDEIICHHPELENEIDRRLDCYGRLDPEVLRLLGADQFPTMPPLCLVGSSR